MKLNKKLLSLILCFALFASIAGTASAANIEASYSTANYYYIATTAYSRMLEFHNGVIIAADRDGHYGLITASGSVQVPFQYGGMWYLGGDLYRVSDCGSGNNWDNSNAQEGIIDSKGNIVRAMSVCQIDAYNGNISVTNPSSYETEYYNSSLQTITNDEYWGYGDSAGWDWNWEDSGYRLGYYNGEFAVYTMSGTPVFPSGTVESVDIVDHNGSVYFVVQKDGKYALMDSAKNVIVDYGVYTSIYIMDGSDYLTITDKNYNTGVMDVTGKIIVPFGAYDSVMAPSQSGYLAVSSYDYDDNYFKTNIVSQIYSTDGVLVNTLKNTDVCSAVYYRDLAFSLDGGKSYGMMKADGTVVFDPAYSSISNGSNGNLAVMVGEDYWSGLNGIVSYDGAVEITPEYVSLSHLEDGYYVGTKQTSDEAYVYGVVATGNQIKIPFVNTDISVFSGSFIELCNGSTYSIVDKDNNIIVPASSSEITLFDKFTSLYSAVSFSEYLSESWDGYSQSIYPFVSYSTAGNTTVYADYKTGTVYGTLPCSASNINENGTFVYIDKSGLYGFAQVTGNYASASSATTAKPTSATVIVDGVQVAFDAYTITDANGGDTTYFKLRDVASQLNGTPAQFNVTWDSKVGLVTGTAYVPNGTEMQTVFSGNQIANVTTQTVSLNGTDVSMECFMLSDASGGGYTYFKLRDIGKALGFNVSWNAQTSSIEISSSEPYDAN